MAADRRDELDEWDGFDRFGAPAAEGAGTHLALVVALQGPEPCGSPLARPRHGGHVAARVRARMRAEIDHRA